MVKLNERIKKLERVLTPHPDRITEIIRPIIRPGDCAVVGVFRTILGVGGPHPVTTDEELSEIGYRKSADGTLSEVNLGNTTS
jgi:hypothetical protein